jgi:molybdopterin converting factor subunit 1
MLKIKILFFATLRDYAGLKSVELEIPPETTVSGLIDLLVTTYPGLNKVRDSMVTAVNREYASGEQVIPENAEIAFFPPVSGG